MDNVEQRVDTVEASVHQSLGATGDGNVYKSVDPASRGGPGLTNQKSQTNLGLSKSRMSNAATPLRSELGGQTHLVENPHSSIGQGQSQDGGILQADSSPDPTLNRNFSQE